MLVKLSGNTRLPVNFEQLENIDDISDTFSVFHLAIFILFKFVQDENICDIFNTPLTSQLFKSKLLKASQS